MSSQSLDRAKSEPEAIERYLVLLENVSIVQGIVEWCTPGHKGGRSFDLMLGDTTDSEDSLPTVPTIIGYNLSAFGQHKARKALPQIAENPDL